MQGIAPSTRQQASLPGAQGVKQLNTSSHFAGLRLRPGGTVRVTSTKRLTEGVQRHFVSWSVPMNYTKSVFLCVSLIAMFMTACSGLGDSGGVVPPPVNAHATLSITLQA